MAIESMQKMLVLKPGLVKWSGPILLSTVRVPVKQFNTNL